MSKTREIMEAELLPQNKGVHYNRVDYRYPDERENMEKIFQMFWNEENTEKPWLNDGYATAQGIMKLHSSVDYDGPDQDDVDITRISDTYKRRIVYLLSEREKRICATVIQWLGTNCGMCFLEQCLKQGGYSISKTKKILGDL